MLMIYLQSIFKLVVAVSLLLLSIITNFNEGASFKHNKNYMDALKLPPKNIAILFYGGSNVVEQSSRNLTT